MSDTTQWTVQTCVSLTCNAPIVWARTDRGSRTPVDAQPSPAGTTRLVDLGAPEPVALYVRVGDRDQFPGELHTTHWASCTDPGRFRRRR